MRWLQSLGQKIGILEIALLLSVVFLVFQVFPGFFSSVVKETLHAIDVRNWSGSVRILSNVLFVLVLIAFRYGPEIMKSLRKEGKHRGRKPALEEGDGDDGRSEEYKERERQAKDWAERAKNRLPHY